MPIDPTIPFRVQVPPPIDFLGAAIKAQQLKSARQSAEFNDLQLQQARQQAAEKQAYFDAARRSGGDITKMMADSDFRAAAPMLWQELRAGAEDQRRKDIEFGWKQSDRAQKSVDEAKIDVLGQVARAHELPGEAPTTYVNKDHLMQAASQIQQAPNPDAALAEMKRDLPGLAEQGDLAADDLWRLIGTQTKGADAAAILTNAAGEYGLSPRASAFKRLKNKYGTYVSVPGTNDGANVWRELGLPEEYDEAAVSAALAGSAAAKAIGDQRKATLETTKLQNETALQPAELDAKWNESISRDGANVYDEPSRAAFAKRYLDMKAPASVIARIPTTYSKAGWGRFMESTRTQQQRDESAEKDRQIGFEREKAFGLGGPVAQSVFDASRPNPTDKASDQPIPGLGLSPNGLYQQAITYGLTRQMPAIGRGSTGGAKMQRDAVVNKASAMAAAAGVDLPTVQAEYKAQSASLTKLVTAYNATAATAYTADLSLQYAQQLAGNLPRTGSPMVNRYAQFLGGHELTGDPALSQFEVAVYTAVREYAKTTSGASQSVSELSAKGTEKAEALLNTAQSPAAFDAAIKGMRQDMANVTVGQQHQIAAISGTVARFLQVSSGDPFRDTDTGKGTTPPAAEPPVPANVKIALKNQMPKTYRMDDGTRWSLYPDGSIHYAGKWK